MVTGKLASGGGGARVGRAVGIRVYAHRAETALHEAAARSLVELAEGRGLWGLPVFCVGPIGRPAFCWSVSGDGP